MKFIRRILTLALALMLCLSLMPANAFSEVKGDPATEKVVIKDSILLNDNARTDQPQLPQPVADPAFVFRSRSSFTLRAANNAINWDGELEYSTDARNWTLWHGETISSSLNNGKYCLYVRGIENTIITGGYNKRWVLDGNETISCSGNIESLLDYKVVMHGEHPQMSDRCFAALFCNCSLLRTAPALPAMELTNNCYESMFYGCEILRNAPALPARVMASSCYNEMFYGCESLTVAPALPAEQLAEGCYAGMFGYCTSLIKPPELPATELAESCYTAMFEGCSALKEAPKLAATTLTEDCYNCMFYGCSSLVYAPDLFATTLAPYCCSEMFADCSSLSAAPALPAEMLAEYCYSDMFHGCTALVKAPALPAKVTATHCYSGMFRDCSSLTSIPALPALILEDACYINMFNGCTSIRLSAAATDEYTVLYSVPTFGYISYYGYYAVDHMFEGTGGPFTGEIIVTFPYYLHNSNSIVW